MNQAEHPARTRKSIAALRIALLISCLAIGHGCSRDDRKDPKLASDTKEDRIAIADGHYRSGCDCFESRKWEQALQEFEKAFTMQREILSLEHPDVRASFEALSLTSIRLKKIDAAHQWIAKWEAVLPKDEESGDLNSFTDALFALSDLHRESGEEKAAQQCLQKAGKLLELGEKETLKAQIYSRKNPFKSLRRSQDIEAAFAKNQHEIFSKATADRAKEELSRPPDPKTAVLLRQIGYSKEQIRDMQEAQREHLDQVSKQGLAAPGFQAPANSRAASEENLRRFGLGVAALTNIQKNPVAWNNSYRSELSKDADTNPALATMLRHEQASVWSGDPEAWLVNAWDHWQSEFESGRPFGLMLAQKEWRDPFMLIPWRVFTNGPVMVQAALNLKGMLIDRELRLQAALTSLANTGGVELARRAHELESQAITNRTKPITLEEFQHEERVIAEIQEWAKKTGADDRQKQRRFEASGLKEPLIKTWTDGQQRQLRVTKELQSVRQEGLKLNGAGRPSLISSDQIRSVLPPDCVLVDYVRCAPDRGGTNLAPYEYAAAILSSHREPVWIALGAAGEIETRLDQFLALMHGAPTTSNVDPDLELLLENLHQRIWSPVEREFPIGTRRVIVCPDGPLQIAPFATLRAGEKFMGERYQLSMVPSPRILLRSDSAPLEPKSIEVWCDPDFEVGTVSSDGWMSRIRSWFSGDSVNASGIFSMRLDRVSSTTNAANELKACASRHGLQPVRIHQGTNATESSLRKVSRPWILHMGTHGFVIPPPQVAGTKAWPTPNAGLDFKVDVLASRSGLALAGAKKTAAALPHTGLTLHGIDGVLTATEAGSLQLEGTSLVVLNVCRSGSGALVESEGLVSLRSALVSAGARDVVSALWDLDEHYANEFSKRFYEAVFRDGAPAASLAEVQSAELRRLASRNVPNPLYESVKLAGPWIVTHGGHP